MRRAHSHRYLTRISARARARRERATSPVGLTVTAMKKLTAAVAAAAAAAVTVAAPVPIAAADDAPAVFDVSALPIESAHWHPVDHYDRTAELFPGAQACAPGAAPEPGSDNANGGTQRPVFIADLRPSGFFPDTQGWTGTLAATRYASVDTASRSLDAYRRYLDDCYTAPAAASPYRNGAIGTSALDPTLAHAFIETDATWMEVFAAATEKGLIELSMTHPKDGDIDFSYNPAALVTALKTADLQLLTDTSGEL